jgi:uridine kinase
MPSTRVVKTTSDFRRTIRFMIINSAIIKSIKNLKKTKPVVLVAIDGGGGAGKSTFAVSLAKQIDNAKIIKIDSYYKKPDQTDSYDSQAPVYQNFDVEKLINDVINPVRTSESQETGIIIIEGVGTLGIKLRDYFDYKIWLEVSPETRRSRGVKRDGENWAKVWDAHYLPEDERYVNEQHPAEFADVVIQNG